ncbi:1-acyl-sn-glycerol-3-phosphate acyltransferase [Mycolicibacterium psychrotolerans]|uniref:Acyltransferase n=1 Tax=Mycolicibacterium psychrotolerans TaxID=216929 RepID=A0A7I7M444_9MYCO|nr:1-acyl-sn-glycerol-3-phosphate acyltransferase [Mycolicibacterium psychrotolerans]BBX66686.1 acyltransferase [Mycolicibacterium psychrotolerans]
MRLLRRALTVPLATVLMICVIAAGPILLAVTGVVGLATRSSRPVRTVALTMAYAVIELRTLAKLLSGQRDGDQLVHEFLGLAYAAVQRVLDVRVVLDPASPTKGDIPTDQPLIVLSRHCGPGDSVLVAWLLTLGYGLRIRVVLKSILRVEPLLDFAGDLGCLCFLDRGDRARRQIRELAASLTGGQALLLFPEGANFSWPRWRAAIGELRSTGGIRAAKRALQQSHTLPPRTGGAAAAVTGAPRANVLVLTHSGFCLDGRARPWWQMPIHRELLVRTALVTSSALPPPDRLGPWLERVWTQVDAWVAANATASDTTSGPLERGPDQRGR